MYQIRKKYPYHLRQSFHHFTFFNTVVSEQVPIDIKCKKFEKIRGEIEAQLEEVQEKR